MRPHRRPPPVDVMLFTQRFSGVLENPLIELFADCHTGKFGGISPHEQRPDFSLLFCARVAYPQELARLARLHVPLRVVHSGLGQQGPSAVHDARQAFASVWVLPASAGVIDW